MEENKRTDAGYTGEYGNPVEHNDAPVSYTHLRRNRF